MEMSFLRSGAALILAGCIQFVQASAGTYRELVPIPRSATDDEQEMAFYLGPLVFRIKNRNLILPFPRGDHPFDGSICGRSDLHEVERKLCADRPKSVFLQIPLSDGDARETALSSATSITLGYKQNYSFYKGSADDFATEASTYDGGRIREPRLDTQNYGAVQILPKKEFERLPNWRQAGMTTYFFIAKGDQSPHVITCTTKLEKDVPADSLCGARRWFLTLDFPEQIDGKFAFSLEYGFLAAKIDEAPLIEQAVVNAVSELPRSRIKWPLASP
jgi:hypothetical protein